MADANTRDVRSVFPFRIADLFRISGFGFRICGLIAFCGLLFFPGLGARDLTSSHEARAAQNAQMILDEGHWLVPRLFDRHLELQKPPLFYWLVALFGWLGGGHVDVWAVRLPAALSALACVLFLYFVGVRSKRPFAGLLAAFFLASSMHFTWLARVGRIDMPLTMTITFALGAFYLGNIGSHRLRWHLFGYTFLGLGLLLKGPIALVLPGMVAGAVWLVRNVEHSLRECGCADAECQPQQPPHSRSECSTMWWGLPLTLAIAAPWYVWANLRTDNQLWEVFFWYHNVERGLGGSEVLKSHPWWFYGPQMAYDLLPWSVAVPVALWWFLRHRELRQDAAACLGLTWFAAMALFLSCMSFKRADYLLPAYPGMAIFLGVCAEQWWRVRTEPDAQARDEAESLACASGSKSVARAGFVLILFACVIGWFVHNTWFIPPEEKAWPYRTMAAEIRGQTQGPVIFFRAESHLLMHRLGQPVDTILEWENLAWWVNRPMPVYFVMPEKCAREWRAHLPSGSLEEVLRARDFVSGKHDGSLVVLRSQGKLAANR